MSTLVASLAELIMNSLIWTKMNQFAKFKVSFLKFAS